MLRRDWVMTQPTAPGRSMPPFRPKDNRDGITREISRDSVWSATPNTPAPATVSNKGGAHAITPDSERLAGASTPAPVPALNHVGHPLASRHLFEKLLAAVPSDPAGTRT